MKKNDINLDKIDIQKQEELLHNISQRKRNTMTYRKKTNYIPILPQTTGDEQKFNFVHVLDGIQYIDKNSKDDRILIQNPKKRKINMGSSILQTIGIYEQDFKPYLFSGITNSQGMQKLNNIGVGNLITHSLYNFSLDRSYIPQAGFPRVQNYMNAKFWGGYIEPYFNIRVNNPRGTINSLVQYGKGLDNPLGAILRLKDSLHGMYESLFSQTQGGFYQELKYPLFRTAKNNIPIFRSLLTRKPKNALQSLIPFATHKYTIEQFEEDYLKLMEQLTKQNQIIIQIRQRELSDNLDRINLNTIQINENKNYPQLRFSMFRNKQSGGSIKYIPIFNSLIRSNRLHNNQNYSLEDFESDYINKMEQLDNLINKVIQVREDLVKKKPERFNISNRQLNYKDTPLSESINNQDKSSDLVRSMTLWKNIKGQEYIINDVMAYQRESYMTPIIDQNNNTKFDYTKGNLIKFWIEDVNNKRFLTTPAYITTLKDSGMSGQWQQIDYAGSIYPKFTYKGVDKRIISFELKLGCFDKKYLPEYIQKLNFFRLIGSPTYNEISVISNDEGLNKQDQRQIRNYSFPKAPIYKLTLGDIIQDQYGFFDSCDLTWSDENSFWNLDKKKTYNYESNINLYNKQIANLPDEIQIPIMTQISVNFVCIYGRGYGAKDQVYYNHKWKEGLN